MTSIKCSCGACEMNFKHLSKEDLPQGWECEQCAAHLAAKEAELGAAKEAPCEEKLEETSTEMVKEDDKETKPTTKRRRKRAGKKQKS